MHSPFILPAFCVSITTVMSLNDIMIVCSPFLAGKTFHMHSKVTLIHLHICWHPCQSFLTAISAMHELSSICKPNFRACDTCDNTCLLMTMHTYLHVYTCIYVHINIHLYMHTHTQIHSCKPMYIPKGIHSYNIYTYMDT